MERGRKGVRGRLGEKEELEGNSYEMKTHPCRDSDTTTAHSVYTQWRARATHPRDDILVTRRLQGSCNRPLQSSPQC